MDSKQLVRFDWAMKRLLRNKADYVVVEGFLSTLLGKSLKITEVLESEGNRGSARDKYNRVDVLVEDAEGALYLIEVQNNNEVDYLLRMLFGVSKVITGHIRSGQSYANVRKVYSINIVYFNLCSGSDTVYHGTTELRGIHDKTLLQLTDYQRQRLRAAEVKDVFPEYYILKVNDFDKWSSIPLNQWLYFLSNSRLGGKPTAAGLPEAAERLRYEALTPAERRDYDRHLDSIVSAVNQVETAHNEGLAEGKELGLAEGKGFGLAEGKRVVARKMRAMGLDTATIAAATGLNIEDIG